MAASRPLPSLRNSADSVSCRGATCSITASGSISLAWRCPAKLTGHCELVERGPTSARRQAFHIALRQLGQPHQKFLDKFLDLFDPVVRGAGLNVSTREIGTTGKIRASGEVSLLRVCRRRTARRIRRFPDVAPARGSPGTEYQYSTRQV